MNTQFFVNFTLINSNKCDSTQTLLGYLAGGASAQKGDLCLLVVNLLSKLGDHVDPKRSGAFGQNMVVGKNRFRRLDFCMSRAAL